jgi:hypothetical protein
LRSFARSEVSGRADSNALCHVLHTSRDQLDHQHTTIHQPTPHHHKVEQHKRVDVVVVEVDVSNAMGQISFVSSQ